MPEVWMVNHYAITPDLPGGTRHYDLASELVRRGFRVKVFASERLQRLGQSLAEVVGRHGDPDDELLRWLDTQIKRNLVLTFGGGVNEIQRELIATAGLGLPRVPRGRP